MKDAVKRCHKEGKCPIARRKIGGACVTLSGTKYAKKFSTKSCPTNKERTLGLIRVNGALGSQKRKEIINMFKKYLSITAMVPILLLSLVLSGCGTKDSAAPKVVGTYPQDGAKDVDPSIKEISVTFNEPMMDKSWSWCYEDKGKFPQVEGQPYYIENNTKNVLPVKLEPKKEYVVWINTANFKSFRDKAGNPTEPYRFAFKTR